MQKKLFLSNKVLGHILHCNENMVKILFRESELKLISSTDLKILCKLNILLKTDDDPERHTFYNESGASYKVRGENGAFHGYRIRGEGPAIIELAVDDASFLKFDILSFLRIIKNENSLTGTPEARTKRLYFIGYKKSGNINLATALGVFANQQIAEKELCGIRSRIASATNFLVLCPSTDLDMDFKTKFEGKGITCGRFDDLLSKEFKISFPVGREETAESILTVSPVTSSEQKKYANDYPRKDVFKFIDKQKSGRKGIVLINGRELELEYNIYGILLAFAKALKSDTDTGWVSYDHIESEKIVRSRDHFHRSMSELSGKLDPFVEDNKVKILQNLKRKSKYRLSTMPSRIKVPHTRWLASRYKVIKGEIIKERTKRVGAANL